MKKTIMSLFILSVLLLSVFNVYALGTDNQEKGAKIGTNRVAIKEELSEDQISALKAEMPESYESVEKELAELDIQPTRFLLWTNDGAHIMWGTYANGHFYGADNEGNKAWGIYHDGVWAGFYDEDKFFYGKYGRGRWVAHGLFGMRTSSGRFISFPRIRPARLEAASIKG